MALPQSALSEILEAFRAGDGVDLIRESVRVALQELIELEATDHIGAAPYERSEDRVNERNGHRSRTLTTKAGDVELRIPWMLLGFADPSSRTVFTPKPEGGLAFSRVGSIRVDGRRYTWKTWNRVQWRERRKQGWSTLKSAYERAAR